SEDQAITPPGSIPCVVFPAFPGQLPTSVAFIAGPHRPLAYATRQTRNTNRSASRPIRTRAPARRMLPIGRLGPQQPQGGQAEYARILPRYPGLAGVELAPYGHAGAQAALAQAQELQS